MTQGVDINFETASGTALHPGSASDPTTPDIADYPRRELQVGNLLVKKQRSYGATPGVNSGSTNWPWRA